MAANMADLLQLMVDRGASDLHITSGTYPQIRVSGRLTQLTQFEVLTPQDTQRLAYSVLNEGQKQKFEEENELDLSFGIQGLARFRCNVYRQRGAVVTERPTFWAAQRGKIHAHDVIGDALPAVRVAYQSAPGARRTSRLRLTEADTVASHISVRDSTSPAVSDPSMPVLRTRPMFS